MGLGLPTTSTSRNDPVIGNHHLRAPIGDMKVEGANVRTCSPVSVGANAKQVIVTPNAGTTFIGWVTRKAEGDKATSRDADFAANTVVNVEAGPGVIREARVASANAVALNDYLCSAGDGTLRTWVSGTDAEGAKLAKALEAKAAGAAGRIAFLALR